MSSAFVSSEDLKIFLLLALYSVDKNDKGEEEEEEEREEEESERRRKGMRMTTIEEEEKKEEKDDDEMLRGMIGKLRGRCKCWLTNDDDDATTKRARKIQRLRKAWVRNCCCSSPREGSRFIVEEKRRGEEWDRDLQQQSNRGQDRDEITRSTNAGSTHEGKGSVL